MLVGSSAVQVELSRLLGVFRTENDLLVHVLVLADVTTTYVEGFLGRQGILLAIDDDHAIALTTVHDTDLTVVEEVLLLDGGVYVETELKEVLQLQILRHRHGATEDEAVVMAVGEVDLVGLHHLLHDKALAQRLRVVVLHVLRMTGRLEVHCLLG